MIGFGLILIVRGIFEKPHLSNLTDKHELTMTDHKIHAKILRMVSHNPETQSQLSVNADKAAQSGDKITLNNPIGIFDNPGGKTSLQAKEASYYESDREVHFLEKVDFDHFSGFAATTNHAVLNTQTQNIFGDQGITAHHQNNTITSRSYEICTGKNTVHFSGNVCLSVSRKKF
jgi:hypothetical protein